MGDTCEKIVASVARASGRIECEWQKSRETLARGRIKAGNKKDSTVHACGGVDIHVARCGRWRGRTMA